MKILVISDLHGRTRWKKFINKAKEYDAIVFLCDFVDSFFIPHHDQIINLKELIKFKQDNDNVYFVIGNHDLSYMYPLLYRCPGYTKKLAQQATPLYQSHEDLFTYAVELDSILFTHAGVSTVWLDRYNREDISIADKVNKIVREHPMSLNFHQNQGRKFSSSGNEITQSPVWIRPESLLKVSAHSYQVVGHTQIPYPDINTSNNRKVLLTDSPDYYTVITDGKPSIHKY